MNLSKEDLLEIKNIVQTTVDDSLRIQADLHRQDLKAMENRMENRMDKKLQDIKNEIVEAVAETIDSGILPQIADHEDRIIKIEKHIGSR